MPRQAPASPIAIAGMHRSGTSMITRGLHDSGLHLIGDDEAELISAAEDNPEGFWENKAIVACNDDLLEAAGGSWDDPPALPPLAVDDPRVAHLAPAATDALATLRQHEHWGFKDPRVCLTASYWLDLQPDLKFIICVRHPLEVALSLKRRNQNSYSLGLSLWELYYATVLDQVPEDRRIVTHYDMFFRDPAGELGRLCDFAGLEPAEVTVRADLRHHDIDVSLEDAGTTDRLRSLYADLCREAGVALGPTRRSDERRVRRLILDGAVAQRHSEQRQAAIERLQEREQEFRAEIHDLTLELAAARRDAARERAELEVRHRIRLRELEVEVSTLRRDGPQMQLLRDIAGSVTRTEHRVEGIEARTKLTSRRVEKAVRVAQGGRYGRALRRRLAPLLRRSRRGVAKATATSTAVTRRSASQATAQLPRPAQKVVRTAVLVVRDPRRRAAPAARSVVRRLPAPAQDAVTVAARRSRNAAVKVRRRLPAAIAGGSPQVPEPVVVAQKAPKGPSPRLWRDDYDALVAEVVPAGDRWAVLTPGSPGDVRKAATPAGVELPPGGKPFVADVAHVAAVEAARYDGVRWLVVPEGSRGFLAQHVELADHLAGRYRLVADRPGAGLAFDLHEPAAAGARSLGAEVRAATAGLAHDPSVLDWTDLDVGGSFRDLATFRAPVGATLPYPDGIADVVVTTPDRDLAEAVRVSTGPVVVVEAAEGGGIEVRATHGIDAEASAPVPALVWAEVDGPAWAEAVAALASSVGARVHVGPLDAGGVPAVDDDDVVVLLERGALPLPGVVAQAAALVAADPEVAVVGKVVRPDGQLEAAGATVFSDRSVGLIGFGSVDVSGPWHEYVRPVCWAPGLLAVRAGRLHALRRPADGSGRGFLRELGGELWASGTPVSYRPELVSVRVAPDPGEPSAPVEVSTWQRVLDLRPQRPTELHDGVWRYLLVNDDVQACRR
jgi:hypothetical protein